MTYAEVIYDSAVCKCGERKNLTRDGSAWICAGCRKEREIEADKQRLRDAFKKANLAGTGKARTLLTDRSGKTWTAEEYAANVEKE